MIDAKRLQELIGQKDHSTLSQLNSELQTITEAYSSAIQAVKNGKQIDEGLFTSLAAALKTATQLSAQGAKKVAVAAKKTSANIKTLYQDNKVQAELDVLVKNLKTLIFLFNDATSKAPILMKRDQEIASEMVYFQKLFKALIDTIGSRMAISKGLTETAEIEEMLAELYLTESQQDKLNSLTTKYMSDIAEVLLESDDQVK